jgi:hypothetical protein
MWNWNVWALGTIRILCSEIKNPQFICQRPRIELVTQQDLRWEWEVGLQGGQFKSHTTQLSLWQEEQHLHLLKGYIDLLFAKGDIFWKCYGDSIEFNQFVFNWIRFNQTKFNSIQIQSSYVQFKLYYANSFNIKSFKWNLIFTK